MKPSFAKWLAEQRLTHSVSESRRLLLQGGVKVNNAVVTDASLQVQEGDVIKVGKKETIVKGNDATRSGTDGFFGGGNSNPSDP